MTSNQRVLITRHGGPDVLQMVEAAAGRPQPGEVLVAVEAAGVAFADVLMRRNLYPNTPAPPFVPGYDVAGRVVAVGAGVTGLSEGDRVAALTQFGGYSRSLRVKAWRCVPIPEGVGSSEAVALVLNYVTAYQMLHRIAGVTARERVLIHGAGGGVGTALIQLARLAHLEVYGTASTEKQALVREQGAVSIDYTRDDFVERVLTLSGDGVDVVFDPIGGNHWVRSYRSLKLGGTLVIYGASAALQNGERNPASLLPGVLKLGALMFVPDGRRIASYYIPTAVIADRNAYRADLGALLGMVETGQITPLIHAEIPLAEADRAHELLEGRKASGKVVLVP